MSFIQKISFVENFRPVLETAVNIMNQLGKDRIPFLFIIDFEMNKPLIIPLTEVDPKTIQFSINERSNVSGNQSLEVINSGFKPFPVSKKRFTEAFNLVQKHIKHGDSFLLNLTMPSRIEADMSLEQIFYASKAKYKLWMKDQLVIFSPEIFIQTNGRKISSFPMKGTMNASLPNAKQRLIESEKELAEHYTIVDLIRNDLSMIAKNVKVERFRYIDHVSTNRGGLLQMSSEICGILPENFNEMLGDIIFTVLPAGSISGAPKKKTLEVIKNAEQYTRGYYTGVMGLFDGYNIDSGVMIRYIEKTPQGLVYKSGGGITAKSSVEEEYKELIDKIYIPF